MGTWLKQLSSITVYHLPTKENKLPFSVPFAANKRKVAVAVFRLQQTNGIAVFR
jgi:hypothetical protein